MSISASRELRKTDHSHRTLVHPITLLHRDHGRSDQGKCLRAYAEGRGLQGAAAAPTLRVRIVEDEEGDPWFTSEEAGENPVEVVPRESHDHWISVKMDFPRTYGALELDRLMMKPGGAFPLANVNLLLGAVTCAGKLSLVAEFVEENIGVRAMETIRDQALVWLLDG